MLHVIVALLWFGAIGCGLMGGVYFAFSVFVMAALERTGAPTGAAAMNAINTVIVRSAFIPLFFATSVAAVALAVLGALRWGEPGALAMLAGGVIYVVGMPVVTMRFNVPLNNALERGDPATADGAALWSRYVTRWTRWNHVRTVASTSAAICFTAALVVR